jgi:hypothetical protein
VKWCVITRFGSIFRGCTVFSSIGNVTVMMGCGWAGLDWSALGLLAAVEAGLTEGH